MTKSSLRGGCFLLLFYWAVSSCLLNRMRSLSNRRPTFLANWSSRPSTVVLARSFPLISSTMWPGIHHQRAVAQFQGGVHVVGNHQAGDVVLGRDFLGQLQHLICGGGVSRAAVCSSSNSNLGVTRVAINRVSAWRWPPESRADRLFHPVLQPQAQLDQPIGKQFAVRLGNAGKRRQYG